MAEWEVCIVRSVSFHLHAGWFSHWFVNPWRGSCFHKTNLQRGNRRSPSDAISSLAKQINFCLYLCTVGGKDTVNVLHVTVMEKYLCASPLNKTNFFTLPEPRDLRDNLTCFDLHKSLYGFEPRAVEPLLRSWPWNLILEDIKMIGLGFLCFCHSHEYSVLILVFLLWLNGSFVGLGRLFTAFWPRFKPKHSQMSVFSVVLQLDYTEKVVWRQEKE